MPHLWVWSILTWKYGTRIEIFVGDRHLSMFCDRVTEKNDFFFNVNCRPKISSIKASSGKWKNLAYSSTQVVEVGSKPSSFWQLICLSMGKQFWYCIPTYWFHKMLQNLMSSENIAKCIETLIWLATFFSQNFKA